MLFGMFFRFSSHISFFLLLKAFSIRKGMKRSNHKKKNMEKLNENHVNDKGLLLLIIRKETDIN